MISTRKAIAIVALVFGLAAALIPAAQAGPETTPSKPAASAAR